jgi:hypothetical protein
MLSSLRPTQPRAGSMAAKATLSQASRSAMVAASANAATAAAA